MTRLEHLAWCKERAREYLDQGEWQNAITSMASDMTKHPETEKVMSGFGAMLLFTVKDLYSAKKFVEGFN